MAARIVFLNRFYAPETPATGQLLADLAEGLAARGESVVVVTSCDREGDLPQQETRRGVEVRRLPMRRAASRGLFAKARAYRGFASAVGRLLPDLLRTGDVVVAMTDPPLLATVAAKAARKADVSLVHWIQDIHPEIGIALSGSRVLSMLSVPWRARRDAAWRSARRCVVISHEMKAFVSEHGVPAERIAVVPNWALEYERGAPAGDSAALRREWGLEGKFVIQYQGNLGRVHDLDAVVVAAERLRDEADLVLLFVGDGPQKAALESEARRLRLRNLVLRPPVSRARLRESLGVGDVHLVTLRAGCERLVYPSKLYGILAAARPVLFVGPRGCEMAREVESGGAGFVAEDADGLVRAVGEMRGDRTLRETMGAAALRWDAELGGVVKAVDRWREVLAGCGS